MAAAGIVIRSLALVAPNAPPVLQAGSLRLMTNLALDSRLRRQLVAGGLVQQLIHLLQPPLPHLSGALSSGAPLPGPLGAQLQPLALGLMYLASMEERGRLVLAQSDLLPR